MVHLDEMLKRPELIRRLDEGYVRSQHHPDDSLVIFNYTNKAQFDNEWDDVTEQTRGLIANPFTEEIVSRPFRKFFNWEQIPASQQAYFLKQPCEVYVKWDGSLGILYPLNTGEYAIATRGSFDSPQAKHATKLLREKYPTFEPILGLTYLFEIIYPENRIVVDYNGRDDLVLLAVIDTETGRTLPSGSYDWPGPVTRPLIWTSLADVLAEPQRPNEEGFVVFFPADDFRVKVKFEDYKRLHSILTNVSTLSIWDALANGQDLEAFIDHVPDEFYSWVQEQADLIAADFERVKVAALEDFMWIKKRVKVPEWDRDARKQFALLALESEFKDVLFGLYDGKDISARLWKRVRPEYSKPWMSMPSEDTA
ncbi:RNA ligase [Streptomyces sp. MI02-2A]|uniref:RNA ligase n=1 Tax=Streptomyces sp. MI02-2A TaxID=3028688 RepID=UPI0029B91C91|nr:RNA ligase [Streptomyces sp. MI02-2A]MDX3260800.1 RNA ligase [Streptomyces sp. MI02-2A]